MKTSIHGARVIDPASRLDQTCDIHIEQGRIIALGEAPAHFAAEQQIAAHGLIAAPGWWIWR